MHLCKLVNRVKDTYLEVKQISKFYKCTYYHSTGYISYFGSFSPFYLPKTRLFS